MIVLVGGVGGCGSGVERWKIGDAVKWVGEGGGGGPVCEAVTSHTGTPCRFNQEFIKVSSRLILPINSPSAPAGPGDDVPRRYK